MCIEVLGKNENDCLPGAHREGAEARMTVWVSNDAGVRTLTQNRPVHRLWRPKAAYTRFVMFDSPKDILGSVKERFTQTGHLDLLCDFDGVLAPIASTPDAGRLPSDVRETLAALAAKENVHVAIVSGRGMPDLRVKVGLEALTYAGNHGFEIQGGKWNFTYPVSAEARAALAALTENLRSAMEPYAGVIVEEKEFTLSLHYRAADEAHHPEIQKIFRSEFSPHEKHLGLREGTLVFEVRPAKDWHKGSAVRWLLEQWHGEEWPTETLPVSIGDDNADEDAFAAIGKDGISVRVGPSDKTRATHRLKDPADVSVFLSGLLHLLS